MDPKDYHKMCEEVDNVAATCTSPDSVNNLEGKELDEANNPLKVNEIDINEGKMEANTINAMDKLQMANEVIKLIDPVIDSTNDLVNEKNIFDENVENNILRDASFFIDNSISPEATTSQDVTPTSFNDIESSSPSSDQNKSKRSISKDQSSGDSNISIDEVGNSSGEDSSKRQKLNESMSNNLKSDEENVDNASKFHKLKSKGKKRNYRNKRPAGDNEESCNEETNENSEMKPESEEGAVSRRTESFEQGLEVSSDGPDMEDADENDSNEWTTASEEELEEAEDLQQILACLRKEKPMPKWFVIPELVRREMGISPLFQRKYYGSLHVAEHFELMYQLKEHKGCVNALNFNQKGNLLASGSDDLTVGLWNWAIGKKPHLIVKSGHRSNIFQVKWLPCDDNLIATSGRDGFVRLLNIKGGVSRTLAAHYAASYKLAVHPDTPHIIISAGEDSKVFSIDIREQKPTKLLVVKDGDSYVQLYSVHSNPLKSYEFCVGGRSPAVRIHDRRKVSEPLYKLYPEHVTGNKYAHVTCAVYNYNGTEVVATYNAEDIYLFDTVSPQPGDFAHRYQGHRNNATVKGINFFGPKSEFIVSGSDCGNIFIWDKNTEAIVNWMFGDEQGVVNCLEPHPEFPVLATSGLDDDVKIWVPSCESPPNIAGLENCVKHNALVRRQDAGIHGSNSPMDWMLVRPVDRRDPRIVLNTFRDYLDDDEDYDTSDGDFSTHSYSQSDDSNTSVRIRNRTLQCRQS